MKVYHGSVCRVDKPDVTHSMRNLDFGKGFYVTTFKEQAVRWAKRKADLLNSDIAIVNEYEMSDKTEGFSVMDFGSDLDNWIDFVCDCRNGSEDYLKYDIIIGKVADDKVYRVVDLYRRGIWDKQRALEEIKVYKDYDQIAFITQRSLDMIITFTDSNEV